MWNAELQWRIVRSATLRSTFRIPNSALGAPANLIQLLEPHQHVPRFGAVRRAEDTCLLQLVDDARRATVPDAHAALQQGRRAQLVLDADLGSLAEQRVALPPRGALLPRPPSLVARLGLLDRGDLLDDLPSRLVCRSGGRASSVPLHQPLGLLGGDERALDANRLALARRPEQHVAVAEQPLRSVVVQDRAAIHL